MSKKNVNKCSANYEIIQYARSVTRIPGNGIEEALDTKIIVPVRTIYAICGTAIIIVLLMSDPSVARDIVDIAKQTVGWLWELRPTQ